MPGVFPFKTEITYSREEKSYYYYEQPCPILTTLGPTGKRETLIFLLMHPKL